MHQVLSISYKTKSIDKRFTSANRSCRSCANFDIEKDSYFTRFDMPKNYPKQQHPDSPQPPNGREIVRGDYLYCRKISFKWLISGINFVLIITIINRGKKNKQRST